MQGFARNSRYIRASVPGAVTVLRDSGADRGIPGHRFARHPDASDSDVSDSDVRGREDFYGKTGRNRLTFVSNPEGGDFLANMSRRIITAVSQIMCDALKPTPIGADCKCAPEGCGSILYGASARFGRYRYCARQYARLRARYCDPTDIPAGCDQRPTSTGGDGIRNAMM